MEKLLVVDGSNLLFQMFYGMPARIPGPNGRPIQGTLGFIGALLKIIKMVKPQYAVVLFDGETHNPRRDLDEDYKANRPNYSEMPQEEVPFSQLPDIFNALCCLEIPYRETVCCEADDWMAGYAAAYGGEMEVILSSQDSDLFQLITDRVSILRYRGEQSVLWTPATLREKLGVEPGQYAAYKALVGDHADNIRGVPKVGPKTAAALMQQFGSLDALLSGVESIARPSVRAAIGESRERIEKNLALIQLSGREALPFSLEALRYRDLGLTTSQVLRQIGLR